jgi:hypothetical protein
MFAEWAEVAVAFIPLNLPFFDLRTTTPVLMFKGTHKGSVRTSHLSPSAHTSCCILHGVLSKLSQTFSLAFYPFRTISCVTLLFRKKFSRLAID